MQKRFETLVPGDKFLAPSMPAHNPVVGVCVLAPEVKEHRRRFLRRPQTIYGAKCIELHRYLGPVEWPASYPEGTLVELVTGES